MSGAGKPPGRVADPDMVARARPPEGFVPIVSNSAFGWYTGPFFERETEDGGVERGFRVDEMHINAGGVCHGGMLMTFADILLSSVVMRHMAPPFVTVRLSTDFLAPAPLGAWVSGTGEGHPPRDGLVAVSGTIRAADTSVATLSGLFKGLRRR